MRLLGYCTECRHFRTVSASEHSLAMMTVRGNIAYGICDSCQDEADAARSCTCGVKTMQAAFHKLGCPVRDRLPNRRPNGR